MRLPLLCAMLTVVVSWSHIWRRVTYGKMSGIIFIFVLSNNYWWTELLKYYWLLCAFVCYHIIDCIWRSFPCWTYERWSVVRHYATATRVWIPTSTVKDFTTWQDRGRISQEVHRTGSAGDGIALWQRLRWRHGTCCCCVSIASSVVYEMCLYLYSMQCCAVIGNHSCKTSTNKNWGVNSQTMLCTSPICGLNNVWLRTTGNREQLHPVGPCGSGKDFASYFIAAVATSMHYKQLYNVKPDRCYVFTLHQQIWTDMGQF